MSVTANNIEFVDEQSLLFKVFDKHYFINMPISELRKIIADSKGLVPHSTDKFNSVTGHKTETKMLPCLPEDIETWDLKIYIARNPDQWKDSTP